MLQWFFLSFGKYRVGSTVDPLHKSGQLTNLSVRRFLCGSSVITTFYSYASDRLAYLTLENIVVDNIVACLEEVGGQLKGKQCFLTSFG